MIGQVLSEWSNKPFVYGRSDCCQFAGAVIEDRSGKNPMSRFAYDDEAEAYDIIAHFGSLEAAVTHVLGKSIDVADSEDGAVLLAVMADGKEMVGVRIMNRMVVKTANSVVDWPLEAATRAWAV